MKNLNYKSSLTSTEDKIKKRSPDYFKSWNFGGRWSSKCAGVRFEVNTQYTVGFDESMPVKILDKLCERRYGFIDKSWLAKANGQYGTLGPVSLFAINYKEKKIAVFLGFPHLQNYQDYITGMWAVGKCSTNNCDVHQSVFNVPDVLEREVM
ncbi:uncharacterized protein LOC126905317 isoform X2 [Daktulosphaira vitifoliae]|uniref:uncharacterized protein LOC126905317 isoform X2 n=1 Tax=Daktulosphaira vitifoliae TaxID=58002 RepID=UPI0021AA4D41|nr:uncharacterized protein LOC126905317 isoform X2 [Daktulosphaira vitifoliae]